MISKHSMNNSLALAALVLTGAAVTRATIPAANGVISACYKKSDSALRVIDSAATCGSNETPLTWNQKGPQGPTGPSDVFVAGGVNAFSAAATDVTLRTLSLPQGSWLINAKVG